MFVDKVKIEVCAGNGGDGYVSFRHEKFIDKGGPDGGDGGDGGDIKFKASRNQNTLAAFRYKKLLKAESGQPGQKRKMHGRKGKDLIIEVPVGTTVLDETGGTVADLVNDGEIATIAVGGSGGFGNAHFVSSTRQAPKVAEKGEKGQQFALTLELKMIADVGLIGLPNAGKSTLLASISNARPEVADYPFTTLRPNLGVVDFDSKDSLLVADIPGLIEGAAEGKGLGDEFLKHVERTSVLIHVIDAYSSDVQNAYKVIQRELEAYKINLTKLPQIIALNKIDGLDVKITKDKQRELQKILPKNVPVFAISAKSKIGVKELLFKAKELTVQERKKIARRKNKIKASVPILRLSMDNEWHVEVDDRIFKVSGSKIERFAAKTDFENYHSVQRLKDIMKKMGIVHELERNGIEPGQMVFIGNYTLKY